MKKVLVIGGGAAGMMAAASAAENGAKVILLEKNEKTGKKIYITGKGRCNLTNACPTEELFNSIAHNSKFCYSSIYGFTNEDVIDFFNDYGLTTKVERGNRVFPVSDHASDVIKALNRAMEDNGVEVRLNTEVSEIIYKPFETDNVDPKAPKLSVSGVKLSNGQEISADAVIVATGGLSYPVTGSTGDGYRWAEDGGHSIKETGPSLTGIKTREPWVKELEGLSLKNVTLKAYIKNKAKYNEMGELLFTRNGISGPLVLTLSALQNEQINSGVDTPLEIDLKPALSIDQLDTRLLREFEDGTNKLYKNILGGLLPAKMIPVFVRLSGISEERRVNTITKEERRRICELLKCIKLTAHRTGGYEEAVVTRGGVNVKELYPATLESRLVKGLFFAGEVIDVDALTGGYNLQIAWSTGHAAGFAAAEEDQ